MDTAQEFIDRVTAALQYPADDTFATTIVVLIFIAVIVLIALALIALGLPGRKEPDVRTNHGVSDGSEDD